MGKKQKAGDAMRLRSKKPKVTRDDLISLLSYDEVTGVFVWLERAGKKSWNTRYAGRPAGRRNDDGYIVIEIFDKPYRAHHLAWLYMTGEWVETIDHKDTVRSNNSWNNLRKATSLQNSRNVNRHSDSLSGRKGVYFNQRRGKWVAKICVNYKQKYLGAFLTEEDAAKAYSDAASLFFGRFARSA